MKKDVFLKIGLILYAIFSIMGISGMSIAAGIAILGLFYLFFTSGKIYLYTDEKNKNIVFVLFLLLLWRFVVSLFLSPAIKISLSRFVVEILEVSLLFCLINVKDFKFKQILIFIVIISAFLQSVYGIIQYFTGIDFIHKSTLPLKERIKGTLGHWNSLGGLLGMVIPIIFSKLILDKNVKNKILFLMFFLVCSSALIFTKTRGAWIGCLLGMTAVSYYKFREKTIIIFLSFIFLFFLIPSTRIRLINTFKDPTLSGRVELWEKSFEMINSYRLFTGWGVDGFEIVTKRFHPHNIYLNNMNENGIFGFSLFILLIFLLFRYVFKRIKIYKETPLFAIYLGILGTLIDFFTHGFVDNILRCETAFLFWFFIGILFSIDKDYLETFNIIEKIEIEL